MPATLRKDAEVSYASEKDLLKIGTLREGGAVDFKDRGEIPQVKEGALLARKIPPEKGVSGVDVYGKVIPARNGNDIILRCGNGVRKSPDGLSFFAISPGRPELLPDGTLCVFPELHIEGDVGLETGHVRFDGFINVKGGIRRVFRSRVVGWPQKKFTRPKSTWREILSLTGELLEPRFSAAGT